MNPTKYDFKFAFFGTSHIAVFVLDELKKVGLIPSLIVTPPDKARGRGLALQPSPVKVWAQKQGVDILQPEKIHSDVLENIRTLRADVAVVVDYGKILPKALLDIPRRGFLNVHPSLLPRLRGPSPIRSAILNDEKETGVSIILVDEEMDHGPIIAQKRVPIPNWFNSPKQGEGGPPHLVEFEAALMQEGGRLLAHILPQWVKGEVDAHEQNHDVATYSEKIGKEDGLLDLEDDAYKNLLKIRAYEGWPGTYAFFERPSTRSGQEAKRIRVGILDAHIDPSTPPGARKLVIDRVKPEGKREMGYEEFLRSGAKPV
ncbi:MAG: methionyl-tRNA formyltransferase [bacterium]|nr:methionyl-tRNA formyltransferase [bacterium]